jgi:hypothetical protein
MAKLTIVFGILLIFLGIAGFVATGSTHPTALIPSVSGLLFVLFGALANTENSKKRMLWMHIAVTIALLLFLGTIPADIDVIRLSRGTVFPHPIAVLEKAGMSLLCLLFVGLCVRSFIEARRQRLA